MNPEQKRMMGLRIRDVRLQRGVMLEELAVLLGVTPGYLANIERGKRGPSLDTIVEIALRMEVSIDYLTLGIRTEADGRTLILRSDEELSAEYMDAVEALLAMQERRMEAEGETCP